MVADEHEILDRNRMGSADMTDVVIVANLLAHARQEGKNIMDWTILPSMERLKLTPAVVEEMLVESEEEVVSIMQALGGG